MSSVRGARLLVADDNKVNRLLLTRNLELAGYVVATAGNGRVALEMLRGERFDLLLLDMEMPELDGFAVLEALKRDLELRDTPVIVTSSLEGIDNVVRCIELGAEDYLPKPVNAVLLRARLSACLEKKRLRDQQKELLRRFATAEVAADLQQSGFSLDGKRVRASVLFCDIRDFTPIAEASSPEETIELLNNYYALMFDAIAGEGGIVTLMVGDGLMAVFGAPMPLPQHEVHAVRAALEMIALVELFSRERVAQGKAPVRIGIGIASGEMVAGYAGTQARATYTCIGDVVNLAARIEQHTKVAGRAVLVDQATRDALPADIATEPLGPVEFKGFSTACATFAVKGAAN
ncbi:MAG: adenylate/guanylate cyclase domain-containing response regulator [Burkholderiales bacterium]